MTVSRRVGRENSHKDVPTENVDIKRVLEHLKDFATAVQLLKEEGELLARDILALVRLHGDVVKVFKELKSIASLDPITEGLPEIIDVVEGPADIEEKVEVMNGRALFPPFSKEDFLWIVGEVGEKNLAMYVGASYVPLPHGDMASLVRTYLPYERKKSSAYSERGYEIREEDLKEAFVEFFRRSYGDAPLWQLIYTYGLPHTNEIADKHRSLFRDLVLLAATFSRHPGVKKEQESITRSLLIYLVADLLSRELYVAGEKVYNVLPLFYHRPTRKGRVEKPCGDKYYQSTTTIYRCLNSNSDRLVPFGEVVKAIVILKDRVEQSRKRKSQLGARGFFYYYVTLFTNDYFKGGLREGKTLSQFAEEWEVKIRRW